MTRLRSIVIVLGFLMSVGLAAAQGSADMDGLLAKLSDPATTDTARQQILKVAETDPKARAYVALRLPTIIREPRSDLAWQNSVLLAGQLKANGAVTSLVDALPRGPIGDDRFLSSSRNARLENDVVGKALSQIGDPAIPPLSRKLRIADLATRKRIIWIFINMKTDSSLKALRQDLKSETDPTMKSLIQDTLSRKTNESP